jgi:hypothetical protein
MAEYLRFVERIDEVPNLYDNYGKAYNVTLDCGHSFKATGKAILNIMSVDCKTCGGSGKVYYFD